MRSFLAAIAFAMSINTALVGTSVAEPEPLFKSAPAVIPVPPPTPKPAQRALNKKPRLAPRLAAIRKRMIARRVVAYRDLQTLADRGDGLAAFRLGQQLEATADPAVASDAVHYYAMAVSLGRAFALSSMVRVLGHENAAFTPAHLQQAEHALLREAARGNAKAAKSLVHFYQSGSPFGKREEQAAELLKTRAGKSDAVAAYQLALLMLSEDGEDEAKRQEIIGYLEIARDHGTIGISASATNLLRMLSTKKEV